jgi:hypothetical protein
VGAGGGEAAPGVTGRVSESKIPAAMAMDFMERTIHFLVDIPERFVSNGPTFWPCATETVKAFCPTCSHTPPRAPLASLGVRFRCRLALALVDRAQVREFPGTSRNAA